MLLDELQQHLPERQFSQYIHPSLLSAIYAATGRKMAAPEPADRAILDDGGNDEDGPRRGPSHGYANDGRRQGTSGKHYMDAEEIDDNLDYGSVDD